VSLDVILFAVFAFIAVLCGISVVVQTHPISSALSLIGVMGSLAVLYLLLGAEFIAAAQMIVYAGAIMVLFVFVIMLLNAGAEKRVRGRSKLVKWLGIPLFAALLCILSFLIQALLPKSVGVRFGAFTSAGAGEVGNVLFTQYLFAFEALSVLILVAILGAVVLGRKEI
jgi:NADH-quinone oxidoreductase subunit J